MSDLTNGGGIRLGATRIPADNDTDTRRAATRYVATIAYDAADLALLLDALGLRPEEGR